MAKRMNNRRRKRKIQIIKQRNKKGDN